MLKEIDFNEEKHEYTDQQGNKLWSVNSGMLHWIKEPFDADLIAPYVAKKRKKIIEERARKRGVSPEIIARSFPKFQRGTTVEEIKAEWDAKRDLAAKWGDHIHDNMEYAAQGGQIISDDYHHYYKWMLEWSKQFGKVVPEPIVGDILRGFCGKPDLLTFRTTGPKSIVDVNDFKTNNFTLDSRRTDQYTGKTKHDDRFFLEPVDHLEDCDYNKFSLQISIYMLFLEEMGYKVGVGRIIKVPWEKKLEEPEIFPVPYMKREAIDIRDYAHMKKMAS